MQVAAAKIICQTNERTHNTLQSRLEWDFMEGKDMKKESTGERCRSEKCPGTAPQDPDLVTQDLILSPGYEPSRFQGEILILEELSRDSLIHRRADSRGKKNCNPAACRTKNPITER